jgi:hypothetical protein
MNNEKFIRVVADHIETGKLFQVGILSKDEIASKVRATANELQTLKAENERLKQGQERVLNSNTMIAAQLEKLEEKCSSCSRKNR